MASAGAPSKDQRVSISNPYTDCEDNLPTKGAPQKSCNGCSISPTMSGKADFATVNISFVQVVHARSFTFEANKVFTSAMMFMKLRSSIPRVPTTFSRLKRVAVAQSLFEKSLQGHLKSVSDLHRILWQDVLFQANNLTNRRIGRLYNVDQLILKTRHIDANVEKILLAALGYIPDSACEVCVTTRPSRTNSCQPSIDCVRNGFLRSDAEG